MDLKLINVDINLVYFFQMAKFRAIWSHWARADQRGCRELVEDVVVALLRWLRRDPGLLQKVVLDEAPLDLELGVEADLREIKDFDSVKNNDAGSETLSTLIFSSKWKFWLW
jgi:hypothetical protein